MEIEIKTCVQVKHFLRERRDIMNKAIRSPNSRAEMIKKGSPLSPHNPFMDDQGLIRVGSRLINSDLTAEAKCPTILPKNDANVTDLIKVGAQTRDAFRGKTGPVHPKTVSMDTARTTSGEESNHELRPLSKAEEKSL